MKPSIYTKISINIVLMFIIGIAMSIVPELHPKFFNDQFCLGWIGENKLCFRSEEQHQPTWHWGYQHWLWFFMGALLFVVQAVKIINSIDKKPEPPKEPCKHDWQPSKFSSSAYPTQTCILCNKERGKP